MSELSELVRDLCPDGVEYRPLEEVFLMRNGYTPSKSNPDFWTNGTIPWFRMEDIRENGGILSDSIQHITPLAVKSGKLFPANSIMLATSATIGEHALLTVDALTNQRFTVFTPKSDLQRALNMKFAFYYFFVIDKWCKENLHISSFPSVDTSKLKKLAFPLPPLAVQEKIVEILDTFTELTAELTDELAAELTARKKQYAYYRDRLLDFGTPERPKDGVEWVELGSVCELSAGGDVPKERYSKERSAEYGVPIYSNGIDVNALYGYTDKAKIDKRCVTIAARGTIGYCALRTEPFFPVVRLICAVPDDRLIADFLHYFVQTVKFKVPTSGIPQLTVPMVSKLKIPIPPLAEQRRIVEILDRFDALCTDLTDGLPAEIAARKKQYEHYRDRLLTFAPLPRG